MGTELARTKTLRVPAAIINETWRALRDFGGEGCEGFVLWLGRIDDGIASVAKALVPPQESVQSEEGVGYFVTSETLFDINRTLHRSGLRLIAQVHSHPTEAYHSSTDDSYAVVTAEGGFSIVVPNFADDDPSPSVCAVYHLRGGRWTELSAGEIRRTFEWGGTEQSSSVSASPLVGRPMG